MSMNKNRMNGLYEVQTTINSSESTRHRENACILLHKLAMTYHPFCQKK